jgi:hypothetical protein
MSEKGLAEDVSDLGSLTPSEIKKPAKFVKGILGTLEVALGISLGTISQAALTKYVTNSDAAGAVQFIIAGLGAGAVDQPDIANVLSGLATTPFVNWAQKLLNKVMPALPASISIAQVNTAPQTTANSTSAASSTTNISYSNGNGGVF